MTHSPEPWTIEIEDAPSVAPSAIIHHPESINQGIYVVAKLNGEICNRALDDAERIVACVNACKGIPTEALDAGAIRAFVHDVLVWVKYESALAEPGLGLLDAVSKAATLFKEHGGTWEEYT